MRTRKKFLERAKNVLIKYILTPLVIAAIILEFGALVYVVLFPHATDRLTNF